MTTTQTPLMDLILPVVLDNLGPEYAQLINNALTRLDSHTHATGDGNQVPSAGIGIDNNLSFNEKAVTKLDFANFVSAVTSVANILNASIYNVSGDLWWKNSAGSSVQLTSGNALAVPGTGAITSKLVSLTYNVTSADAQNVLLQDVTSGPGTLNLPPAIGNGFFFGAKDKVGNAQTNNITIVPNGTDLLENVNASYTINSNFGSIWLVSDNISTWSIL